MTPIDNLLIRDECLRLMSSYCVHLDAQDMMTLLESDMTPRCKGLLPSEVDE